MLFAKALTNSDCCLNISKSGRITLPRVAVEQNLPAVNNRKHNEVVSALDVDAEHCDFGYGRWLRAAPACYIQHRSLRTLDWHCYAF